MHDVAIHVNGAAAWSEFHWDFHATLRKDGSAVTTHGIETQIYRKEEGDWRLVHVHYSEDRQSTP
jgi:ketosteroid isomerase-like protein